MPRHTADALVLRTYKLGEADRIVVFLTSDRGKRRGVAKGARRTRSRFMGGLEPFTRARVEYFEREQRDLVRLSYVDPLASPLGSSSPGALGHASYFAELVDAWAPEADPNERLYRLGASVVDALTDGVEVTALARYFEYWLLRLQGVYPSTRACDRCRGALGAERGAVVSAQAGVIFCRACAEGGVELPPDALAFLHAAAGTAPERAGDLPLSARGERQLATAHRALLALHLDHEPRSVRVLRELGGPEGPFAITEPVSS